MPQIEFIALLLAIVAAITGGAYQLAKSNYHYFCGMQTVINPILIFLCGLFSGLQFSPSVETWKAATDCRANPALNLAPFARWTLRDKAAQRRLALR
jgi:hypothetical protein